MISKKAIQTKVQKLFIEYKIKKPPIDVEKIANKLGIKIKYTSFDSDEVCGLLVRKGDEVILGVNQNHSTNRHRFSIAHEIGHYVLHMTKPIFIDGAFNRNQKSSTGTESEEIEANTFAAELLMPEHFLSGDIEKINEWDEHTIRNLADKYNVSVEALVYRLTNLGYLHDPMAWLR